jgi:hypothetical protein
LLNVTGGVGGRKEERRESWKIRRCGWSRLPLRKTRTWSR